MATKNFSLIDIQDEEQEIDLQFQDFGDTPTSKALGENTTNSQSYYSSFHESTNDREQLLGDNVDEDNEEGNTKKVHSFWTFEYYQQFFDVESKQVGDRIIWSMIPKPGVNYLQSYIRPNPDLYGPFWICITLIFTTAITGNLANYLQTPETYKWKYEFHKVTLASTSIFSYAWLVPLVIYGLLLWRGSKANLSLLDLICLYGYSLAIFVPVSLLWMIPLKWLQWCLGIVASVLSGGVLVRTILPAISHESKKIAIAIATFILILHAALALGFMLYFFYPPTLPPNNNSPSASVIKGDQALAGISIGGVEDAKVNSLTEDQQPPKPAIAGKDIQGQVPISKRADNEGEKNDGKVLKNSTKKTAIEDKKSPIKDPAKKDNENPVPATKKDPENTKKEANETLKVLNKPEVANVIPKKDSDLKENKPIEPKINSNITSKEKREVENVIKTPVRAAGVVPVRAAGVVPVRAAGVVPVKS